MNKEKIVIGSIAAGFLILFGLLIYFTPRTPAAPAAAAVPVDASLLVRSSSRMTASTTAKVAMVEFGDYECPYCGQINPVLEQLIAAYASNPNFNFVFRNFPLPQHSNAVIAAEAAESAGAQGKFWQMHDMIYEKQGEWADSNAPMAFFDQYAHALGLDISKFDQDMASHAFLSAIQADQADGLSIKVDHTPTLFLNGIEDDNQSFDSLKADVDAALAK